MILTQTRTASLILAFGIFFTTSCAHFTSDTTSDSSSSLEKYETALKDIQQEIDESPDNTDLKVQKAEVLYQLAKNTPVPSLRTPYYRNIYDTARDVFYQTDKENTELTQIKSQAWTFEQSQGVALLQQDESENFDRHFNAIITHFDNALTVQPDSLVTYTLKATTLYRHGDVSEAIETLEVASELDEHSNQEITEKLAYLYLEAGDLETSIMKYQMLTEQEPDNHHYKSGLANAYILNEQHGDAIPLLRGLVEMFPTRYEYQEALATELYFIFEKNVQEYLEENSTGSPETEEFENLVSSLDEIITLFDTLQTKIPSLEQGLERTASFYKNAAIKLSRLAENAPERFMDDLEKSETELFEKALPLWQKLAESNPENIEHRKNMYQVYLALGMEDDAEAIERSYNF